MEMVASYEARFRCGGLILGLFYDGDKMTGGKSRCMLVLVFKRTASHWLDRWKTFGQKV